jgi:hypothetical protein
VFSKTSNQADRADITWVQVRTRQAADQLVPLARSAQAQLVPLAKNAQLTASRGMYGARVWAAPRIERTGVAVQENLAPKVSAMMVTTARRVAPPAPVHRRRWPAFVAGTVMVVAGGVAAGLLRSQRASSQASAPDSAPPPAPVPSASAPADGRDTADTAQTDVNGQVRTP